MNKASSHFQGRHGGNPGRRAHVWTPPPPPLSSAESFIYSATNTTSAQQNTVNKSIVLNAGDVVEVGTCNPPAPAPLATPTQVASNDDSRGLSSYFKYTVPAGLDEVQPHTSSWRK